MRVCPLSLIGNVTENVRFCLLEDCVLFDSKKSECSIFLYLTEEEQYISSEKKSDQEFA